MANTFLTISMITNEALFVLRNNLSFTRHVDRQYSDKFGVEGAKIGTTLNVRKPARYLGRTGPALQVEDVTETQVPVTLDTQFGVDVNFTSADLLLNIDQFSKRLIQPAVAAIANKVDFDGMKQYVNVWNFVGTPATIPSTLLTYLNAGVALDNNATPMDGNRYLTINPQMQANIVDALKGLFQSSERIKEQYEKGRMGEAIGLSWYMDQNVFTHTIGVLGGVPLIDGAGQTGASILTKSWTNAAAVRLLKGDIVTFAGVFQVNPQNRQSTGVLQPFVVTADTASTAGGALTIPIAPSIIVAGATQTVTVTAADGAAITVFGAASAVTPQGLAFHQDAFTLATADLPLPRGVDMAARAADPDLGISIRLVRAYDIQTDKFPCRLDILYGWAALRPETACRIAS